MKSQQLHEHVVFVGGEHSVSNPLGMLGSCEVHKPSLEQEYCIAFMPEQPYILCNKPLCKSPRAHSLLLEGTE